MKKGACTNYFQIRDAIFTLHFHHTIIAQIRKIKVKQKRNSILMVLWNIFTCDKKSKWKFLILIEWWFSYFYNIISNHNFTQYKSYYSKYDTGLFYITYFTWSLYFLMKKTWIVSEYYVLYSLQISLYCQKLLFNLFWGSAKILSIVVQVRWSKNVNGKKKS